MKQLFVGTLLAGALALAGCGGSDKKVEIGVPAQSVATTSTTFKDSLVCIQDAQSPLPWGDEAMREPPCPSPSTATVPEEVVDRSQMRAAQSDLRNALTAQKLYYTDTQEYTTDFEALEAIEPSLDWGGDIKVVIGTETTASGVVDMVCISTTAASEQTFSIGDHPLKGTYFGTTSCPAEVTFETLRALGDSW